MSLLVRHCLLPPCSTVSTNVLPAVHGVLQGVLSVHNHQNLQPSAAFNTSSSQPGRAMTSSRPITVRHNLKFQVHDDLEKKFMSFYPDLVHVLSDEFNGQLIHTFPPVTKLLTNNLSTSVLGKRYGLLVPRSYKELGRGEKEEEAIVLGWTVELNRAVNNLTSEIIHDLEKNRRGKPTWHKKNHLGQSALSHVKILESSVFMMIKKYFRDSPCYFHCMDMFVESLRQQAVSYSLDVKLNSKNSKPMLQVYDMWRYKTLVYSTKTYPCLVLPVSLALYLADLNQETVHEQTKQILTQIGLLHQVRQDFENCFKHAEEGDIARGRVTWLVVLASQRGSPTQLRELEMCYGETDPESIARVKQIYYELKLHKNIPIYIEEKTGDIEGSIQQMAKVDSVGLSQSLFFKILGDISGDTTTFIQSPGYYQG